MKIMMILATLLFQLALSTDRLLATSTYSDQDLMILMERAQIRGDYQDVCSERYGALISNARELTFLGTQFNNSPFRDSIYTVDATQGSVKTPAGGKIYVDLMQSYEINTVILWLYDVGTPTYNIKVTLKYKDTTTQDIYTNTAAPGGILRLGFDAALVSRITITAVAGIVQLIKIQAYYAF